MMTSIIDCQHMAECLEAYLDKTVPKRESARIEAHLFDCEACRESVRCSRAVHGLLEYVQMDPRDAEVTMGGPEVAVIAGSVHERLGAAPWWAVSALLHILIIALASLASMAITAHDSNEDVVTYLVDYDKKPVALQAEAVKPPKPELSDALKSKRDTPLTGLGTDSAAPLDFLAMAALGNRDETVNLELPDTHSAHGNIDAHIFDRPQGDVSPAGGGGNDGLGTEDPIGYGGAGSKGDGGGHGCGFGTGDGTDNGSGSGTFGRPTEHGRHWLVMQHIVTPATENAVGKALRWLAYHQEPDGHWDTVKYGSGPKTDTAMTGMALLAFVGAGNTEKVGQYHDNVKNAVAWLKSKQQPSGLIYDPTDAGSHRGIGYPHAIATLGMVEAAGMGRVPDTKAAAQRAVAYATEQHQCGDGSDKLGWRYGAKQAGDLSVTGWFVMALKSAKIARLHVDPAAFEGAIKFVNSVEFKDGQGDDAYGSSHFGYRPGDEHAGSGFRLTAIGTLVRQYCGKSKEETQGSVDWFLNKGGVPSWGVNGESVDLYYWYYGSMACFQQDGDAWKRWNVGMAKTLVAI